MMKPCQMLKMSWDLVPKAGMKLSQFAEGGAKKEVCKIPIEKVWLHMKYPTEELDHFFRGKV